MVLRNILLVSAFLLYISLSSCRTLTEILSHYDTINKEDFQHNIVRRSSEVPDKRIDFISHGKKFHMKLEQSKGIFSKSFSVVTVDRYGNEEPLKINLNNFYEGYVEEDATSFVTAQVEDDGMITAAIDTANETYIVEPMWRHTSDPSHDMIVYKASDVKWNISLSHGSNTDEPHVSVCGTTDLPEKEEKEEEEVVTDRYKRSRRNTGSCTLAAKDSCSLHLVADYNFFKEVGRGDAKTATHYMLTAIKRVDVIYRETCWEHIKKKGVGIQVKKITVHTSFSDNAPRYNKKLTNGWNVDRLLTEFSRDDHSQYCLAHLFTYQDFQHGVIGLAYVASKNSRIGGICSPRSNDRLGARYHNCGLTTYINWGRKLTTLESTLVTAHEIGHNFGSNHDPSRCSAKVENGRYVMYATSVTGAKSNNRKFSQCSTEQIGAVLNKRLNRCLKPKGKSVCGNGVEEENEKCDEGDDKSNPCCKNCKLINGAVCSDSNHICCKECQYATKESQTVCKGEFALGCKGQTVCNGTSKSCPDNSPALDSGICIIETDFRRGNCTKGKCVSLCKLNGSLPCSCPAGESSCKVCCKASDSAKCIPTNGDENDGVECEVSDGVPGLCDTGKCQKLKLNVKETFKSLLEDFTLDKAVRFMRNNIVLTILFFSLLLWIPAGCIVNQIDRNMENKRIEHESMKDQLLIKPKGSFKKKKTKDDEGLRERVGQQGPSNKYVT